MDWSRWHAGLLSAVVVAAWLAVGSDAVLRPPAQRDWAAERRPAPVAPQMPRKAADWSRLPAKLESWWSDAIGGREWLLRQRSMLRVSLDLSPGAWIESGDEWLWYQTPEALAARRGTRPISTAEAARYAGTLKAAHALCARVGARYCYVICPDKETVHAERVPAATQAIGPTRREEFATQVAALAGVAVLDLAPALREETAYDTDSDPVYFRYGTHWTPRGSWRAGVATLTWMAEQAGTPPPQLPTRAELWRPSLAQQHHDSWAGPLHLEGWLHEAVPDAAPQGGWTWRIESEGAGTQRFVRREATGPKIILCADSFGPYLAPWLAMHAREVLVIAAPSLSLELLEQERPDWVLHAVVERQLAFGPPAVRAPVRVLSESEWRTARSVASAVLTPDAVTTRGEARTSRVDSGLQLHCGTNPLDAVVVRLPRRTQPCVLALSLDASQASTVRVAWRGTSDADFLRLRSHAVALVAGRNHIGLELPEGELQGDILLSGRDLHCVLQAVEWRELAR